MIETTPLSDGCKKRGSSKSKWSEFFVLDPDPGIGVSPTMTNTTYVKNMLSSLG